MGSMMKLALPAAAVAAPFMFPGIGAAMGLGGAAGGGLLGSAGSAAMGAIPTSTGLGGFGAALGSAGNLGLSAALPGGAAAAIPAAGMGALDFAGPGLATAMGSSMGAGLPAVQGSGLMGLLDKLGGMDLGNLPLDQLQGLMGGEQPSDQPPPVAAAVAGPPGGGAAPVMPGAGLADAQNRDVVGGIPQYGVPGYGGGGALRSFAGPNPPSPYFQMMGSTTRTQSLG